MKDVARAAGVNQSTVSRILNDTPLVVPVSRETRERVLAAAAELAYRPNPMARALRGAPTMLLGAIVRDVTDPFFAGVIDALSIEARHRGYSVVLGHARSQADEALALATVLEARQCDAIVIVGDMRTEPRVIDDLMRVRVPVIAAWHGSGHDAFLTVNLDNRSGMKDALEHLVGLGHKRIAFVGETVLGDIQERREAFEVDLARRGIAIPNGYVQPVRNDPDGGQAAFASLHELPEPPTAIAAATDVIAIGILHAAFERGIRVPQDLSIVGFDDIAVAAATVPALTTLRMPIPEMITAVLDLAVDESARNALGPDGTDPFRPALVVRSSTAPPRTRG